MNCSITNIIESSSFSNERTSLRQSRMEIQDAVILPVRNRPSGLSYVYFCKLRRNTYLNSK